MWDWEVNQPARLMMQVGLEKAPDDVPLAQDFAKSEEDCEIMKLFFIQKTVAHPLVGLPNVPKDRVFALCKAFIEGLHCGSREAVPRCRAGDR